MKRFFTCVLALTAVAGAAFAEVTLEQCRELARANYPLIRQYELLEQATEYTLSNARKCYLPQFGVSGQATWQNHVASYPGVLTDLLESNGVDVAGVRKDQYKLQVDLSQNIWDGGQSQAEQAVARAQERESAMSVEVDLYKIDEQIDNLFFGILLLDAQKTQTLITIRLLKDDLSKINSMLKNGTAMQSDADAMEAELLSMGQRLTQVNASRESYARMLGLFTGLDIASERLAEPLAAEPPTGENNRPELRLFDAQKTLLTERERAINASVMPQFSLFGQAYYGYPGLNFMEAMMNHDWSFNFLVGVKVSWNIGAFYTKSNNLNKLGNAREQVEVQRDVFLFNNRLETTEQHGEIDRLKETIADDDRIVELRGNVRQAAESRLRNGIIDTNDLLQKIADEDNAAAARNMRRVELLKAIYQLKHTVNQ